jgi:outer membrane protein
MKQFLLTTSTIFAFATLSSAAFAASDDSPFKAGDILLRARAIDVVPQEDSSTSVGGSVNVDNQITPELDVSYFFTPNISAELIAATAKHNLSHSAGADAGSAWLLPTTLTVQYHVTEWANTIIPYVGAGINYTHFYNVKGGDLGSVDYDDSVGIALQAGADVPLGGNWYANVDAKKIYINTTAKFSSGVRADVDIDPFILGAGVGYHF